MMRCQRCQGDRIVEVQMKCPDGYDAAFRGIEGSVIVLGVLDGGEYVEIAFCAECGQVRGDFPAVVVLDEDREDPESSTYDSVAAMIDAMVDHDCGPQECLASSDVPPNLVRYVCTGCASSFGVTLKTINLTITDLPDQIRKKFLSAAGRVALAEEISQRRKAKREG